MSVFNEQAFLSEAMNSILGQIIRDCEFLVINDGSTERSIFCRRFARSCRHSLQATQASESPYLHGARGSAQTHRAGPTC